MSSLELHRKVRNFLDFNHNGFLSTLSNSQKGYPFGSITPYDVGKDGKPVIFISFLAEHYKNLVKEPKACLTIPDWYGHIDPQLYARLSIIGEFKKVTTEQTADNYWERFPEANERKLAHNFCFYELEPHKFRWVGGFGEIYWIDAKEILSQERDEICYTALPAVRHMNEDHQDALQDYLSLAKIPKESRPKQHLLTMTHMQRDCFNIRSNTQDNWTISFEKPINTPEGTRAGLIKLLKQARSISM